MYLTLPHLIQVDVLNFWNSLKLRKLEQIEKSAFSRKKNYLKFFINKRYTETNSTWT